MYLSKKVERIIKGENNQRGNINSNFHVEKRPYDIGEVKTISEPTNRPKIGKINNQSSYNNRNCINFNISNNLDYLY